MPSSSAYAAPIELDLRPGVLEMGVRVVGLSLAAGALWLAELPLHLQFLGVALALLLVLSGASSAAKRSPRMRMYADGGVECAIPCRSALARDSKASRASALLHIDDDLMAPATLLQASSFLGLTELHWADADERHHACMLFPDRLDRATRHRLRVWLATHRPETPSGALLSGSAPR